MKSLELTHKQNTCSTFYQTGLKTKSTDGEGGAGNKWIQNKSGSSKIQPTRDPLPEFKAMQFRLLELFTEAKKGLEDVYRSTVIKIRKVEKLLSPNCDPGPLFFCTLELVNEQIDKKLTNISQSVETIVLNPFLFDQLHSNVSKENMETKENQPKSKKQITSTIQLSQKKITHILETADKVSDLEYQNTVLLRPKAKKIENLSWLTGCWPSLEKICLEGKSIENLPPLSTIEAPYLHELNIFSNSLKGLSSFSQAYFPNLATLNLKRNHIVGLNGLQEANLPALKILDLSQNRIKNIQILSEVGFSELVQLNLSENLVSSIDCLPSCNFPKLEILNVDKNQLKSLDPLALCSYPNLKILSFCHNELSSIDCLSQMKLKKLQALLGYNNQIRSIDFLEKCTMPNLREIFLNSNRIKDIDVIRNINFKHLRGFDLEDNQIQQEEFLCFVSKNTGSHSARKKYPFIQF